MSAVVDLGEEDIFTALVAFIQPLVGADVPIVRGYDNRVSMPPSGFISLLPLVQIPLATNTHLYTDPGTATGGTVQVQRSTQFDCQLDCFGPQANKWATLITTLFRDDYGVQALQPTCAPLYAGNPTMLPLVNGEQQYEERWYTDLCLQYNPSTTVSQQFAGALSVDLISVDEKYPPS